MKISSSLFFSLIAMVAVAIPSGTAFAELYLYDVLAKPAYLKSWNALFIGEKEVDPWLTSYSKTRNGPATPGETVQVDGNIYQINFVCKAHDCGDNRFYVLFAYDGSKAWGYLLKNGKGEHFFGTPDGDKMNALRAAARGLEQLAPKR